MGPKRCLSADLAVVSDLASFISPHDDAMWLHVLAIIALGTPVITAASWSLARGNLKDVPAASVICYRPLAKELKVLRKYDAHLFARSSDVVRMLRGVSGRNKNMWVIGSAGADVGGGSSCKAAFAKGGGKGGGGSEAAVVKGGDRAAAGGKGGGSAVDVGMGIGQDVIACGQDVELVKLDGLGVLRACTATHRCIHNVSSSRAWGVHEPLM